MWPVSGILPLYPKFINDTIGYSVFKATAIPKGSLIVQFKGSTVRYDSSPNNNFTLSLTSLCVGLDGFQTRCISRYINHARGTEENCKCICKSTTIWITV